MDSLADSILSTFGSVVAAVRCSVEIQEELKTRNAELPDSRTMRFRIGVNIGDIIADDDSI